MQEKTALSRLGDVILWLGTIILAVCIAASAVKTYWYIVGYKAYVDQKAIFEIKIPDGGTTVFSSSKGTTEQDVLNQFKEVAVLLEEERRGELSKERQKYLEDGRLRGAFPEPVPDAKRGNIPLDKHKGLKVVKTQEAKRVLTTRRDTNKLVVASGVLALGLISWLVLASIASIACIFNGRSPVAVLKGLFSRT